MAQCGFEDPVRTRCAGVALAPVAGEGVEGCDSDPAVGVVGHGDEFVHGIGVDQVVEEATAALTDAGLSWCRPARMALIAS